MGIQLPVRRIRPTRRSLVLLASYVIFTSRAFAADVKVMSYNVLANWDRERADRIVAVVDDQAPDVLGLQEVAGSNTDYLYARLSDDYEILFADTLDPVLIDKDSSLQIVDQGTKELFRCTVDRQVNWVRLEASDSGEEFIFYNTHLCFMLQNNLEGVTNEEANQIQAGEIIDLMTEQAESGLVQIVVGDMNTFASSNTTRFFIEQRPLPYNGKENPLRLMDSWPAAPGNTGEKPSTRAGRVPGQTTSGPGPAGMGMAPRFEMPDEPGIDWIFVSEDADVTAAQVIRDKLTIGTSDHLPVTATISID